MPRSYELSVERDICHLDSSLANGQCRLDEGMPS